MKKFLLLLAVLFFYVGGPALAQEQKNVATTVFSVAMHCENCKRKIENNISYEKGVKDLLVDLEKKTVTITFKTDKTTSEKLLAAIKKLGYNCLIKEEIGKQEQGK